MNLAPYWKAIVAAIAAASGSLGAALTDNTITTAEGVTAALAVLAALGITWAVPNRKPEEQR